MVRFLLVILLCDNAGHCEWKRQPGFYRSEERCAAAALAYDSKVIVTRFKCVMLAPDQSRHRVSA
jgi:hypothetical protein